jgi:2-C-methyl-D-erythritol 4-phosphate cytidylyltransferase
MSFRDTVTGLFVSAKEALSRPPSETVKQTFRRSEDHRILERALAKALEHGTDTDAYVVLHDAIREVLDRP